MWGESKQATSATTSLVYITLGGLIDVWTIVYWFYLRSHGGTDLAYLYVAGFFFSGLVLFLIGLAVGRIGTAARPAEVAPVPTSQVIAPGIVATNSSPAGPAVVPVAHSTAQPAEAYHVPAAPAVPVASPHVTGQVVPN